MEVLAKEGQAKLRVDALASQLGVTKGSFYWHFKNRDDLFAHLLDYWTHELTQVVTSSPEVLALGPRRRLERTAEMILDGTTAMVTFAGIDDILSGKLISTYDIYDFFRSTDESIEIFRRKVRGAYRLGAIRPEHVIYRVSVKSGS